MKKIPVKDFLIGEEQPLTIMSGPCAIESLEHTLRAAEWLSNLFKKLPMNLVFKASFDKANRSSINSFRGPGIEEGLKILQRVKDEFDLPIITDIHEPSQAAPVAEVADILQIPAFLCRQTDLLIAAAQTPAVISVKKGQFVSPWDMKNVVDKIRSTGNDKIILTERGFSFGYNNLVTDMRAIPIMDSLGAVVCFDASHSVQLPGGQGTSSGGQREFIPTLAKAAVAAGCHSIFIESHPDPANALSDKASVYPFKELPKLLNELQRIYEAVHEGAHV
jgi:2-dehydro-3-deoxyphosphooctonate aldolase (KDO 8-P synthase)